MSVPRNTPF